MENLISLPSPHNENLLLSITVDGALISCAWVEGDRTPDDKRAETIALVKAALFSENHLDMRKLLMLCEAAARESSRLHSISGALEEKHGVGNDHIEYVQADNAASRADEIWFRARHWLCAYRPVSLSECGRQIEMIMSREDMLLKECEFDALERAGRIIKSLASYLPPDSHSSPVAVSQSG